MRVRSEQARSDQQLHQVRTRRVRAGGQRAVHVLRRHGDRRERWADDARRNDPTSISEEESMRKQIAAQSAKVGTSNNPFTSASEHALSKAESDRDRLVQYDQEK